MLCEVFKTSTKSLSFTGMLGDGARDLVDYFEGTWIGGPHEQRAVGRRLHPFPVRLWNNRMRNSQGPGHPEDLIEGWCH